MFSALPGKGWKWNNISVIKDLGHWPWCWCWCWWNVITSIFFSYQLRPWRFWRWEFLFTLQNGVFSVNFYIDLHFQGHLLQDLDDQTLWWLLDENGLNGDYLIFNGFFRFFQVDTFPRGKLRLIWAATSIHAETLYRARVFWS